MQLPPEFQPGTSPRCGYRGTLATTHLPFENHDLIEEEHLRVDREAVARQLIPFDVSAGDG